jgi:nicotinate phosphoribosyltransferase
MVQLFMALDQGELEAFRAYAEIYPDDCLLLVDTINTLESGVPNAIKVFDALRKKGHTPVGIRLDSGDLAYLSIQSAKMLDEAGFPDTIIVLSNDLDELVIMQILTQIQEEAPRYGIDPDQLIKRLVYGVGTRLIVSEGDSALGGVYKMVAVYDQKKWIPAIKISETPSKTPNPGNKRVWRLYDYRGKATADLLTLEVEDPQETDPLILHHPDESTKHRSLTKEEITKIEPLLKEYVNEGKLIQEFPSLDEIRKIRENDLELLDPGVRRLINPHIYNVSLSESLWEAKQALIATALSHSS